MATKLDKTLKRELDIAGEPYMLTIAPDGIPLAKPEVQLFFRWKLVDIRHLNFLTFCKCVLSILPYSETGFFAKVLLRSGPIRVLNRV